MSARPTFAAYEKAGFKGELLPIAPPGAKLAPRSNIKPEQVGKVPMLPTRDGWVGVTDWANRSFTSEETAKFERANAGIGIQCRTFPAVDIDVRRAEISTAVRDLAVDMLGDAPCRVGCAPKCLLIYRGDLRPRALSFSHPADPPATAGKPHQIEILGRGRQFVAEGIHRGTGNPYTWDKHWPASKLTEIDEDQVDRFLHAAKVLIESLGGVDVKVTSGGSGRTQQRAPEELLAPNFELVREMLGHIPNHGDLALDYDRWIGVLGNIKGATGGSSEGLELAHDWSSGLLTGGEDGANAKYDAEVTEAKWASFNPPRSGWEELKRRGSREVTSTTDDADTGRGARMAMFERSVWVEELREFVDIEHREVVAKENFDIRWNAVGDPSDHKKRATAVFKRHSGKLARHVRGVTYRPGSPVFFTEGRNDCVNLWRPPPPLRDVPFADDDVRVWLDHAAALVPDPAKRRHVLDLLAWIVQNPSEKPNYGLLLGGMQGIGKSLLINAPMMAALGSENVRAIQASDIGAAFTGFFEKTKLIICEEIKQFESKDASQWLKPILAAPPYTLRVNPKYGRQYETPNILAGVFFTNHRAALALEAGDRRLLVIWSEAKPAEPAYYRALLDFYAADGDHAVARWLLARDLAGWDAKGRAPVTDDHDDMRKYSRTRAEEFIEDGIANATGPFTCDLVTVGEVAAAMTRDAVGQFGEKGATRCALLLREAGAQKVGERLSLGKIRDGCSWSAGFDPKQAMLYSVRNHERYALMSVDALREEYWRQRREKAELEALDPPDDPFPPHRAVQQSPARLQGQVVSGLGAH
ncbi:DUF5906 domain-containing protein [Phenylobacterium sp.]|uniref:DUF5906 domain-containing protein n=1 Tax=Phenylobacterium sp. TaxID=1871053 RepID=UPI003BA8B592